MTPLSPSQPGSDRTPGAPWAIQDAAAFLGVSVRHLIRQIDGRKVKAIRIGRRRLIPDGEVRRIAEAGI
jgi:excisionase family DNA binding protein